MRVRGRKGRPELLLFLLLTTSIIPHRIILFVFIFIVTVVSSLFLDVVVGVGVFLLAHERRGPLAAFCLFGRQPSTDPLSRYLILHPLCSVRRQSHVTSSPESGYDEEADEEEGQAEERETGCGGDA